MRVLVCGSRTYGRERLPGGELGDEIPSLGLVHDTLRGLADRCQPGEDFHVVHGAARGADTHARLWVEYRNRVKGWLQAYVEEPFPADWKLYGKRAGPIRNQQMLDSGELDFVLAFVDQPLVESRGTHDMVCRARTARIPTYVVEKMGV